VTRPLIAVPSYPRIPERRIRGWNADNVGVPVPYLEALRRAGGLEAVVMTEPLDADELEDSLDRFDGMLLLGGGDLDPATYRAERATEKIYGVHAPRDTSELALVQRAVDRGMPILAICRGHQVLNVALGGVLDQHIPDRRDVGEHGEPGRAGGASVQDVEIVPGTRLAAAMQTARARCSCHHHQAVERTGDGLVVAAFAADGIVEATEPADPGGPWIVSVQWHPEDTAATDPAQQGLFDELVRRARRTGQAGQVAQAE
jgi:putative glutamine amidotransferase